MAVLGMLLTTTRLKADRECRRTRRFAHAAFVVSGTLLAMTGSTRAAGPFVSPDILVLGDSQLSFGSGKVMLDFFQHFDRHCAGIVKNSATLARVAKMRTTMIGTRSTSLQSWTSTKGPAWVRLCRKDPKWGVNASVWGHNSTPKRLYYQVGEGRNYQFCKQNKTPLQAMLRKGYYKPKLVFFYLIGNGSGRLAGNRKAASGDVKRLVAQLPENIKCVYMTTTPIHTPRRNRTRVRAEANLRKAFATQGNRCSFVSALKPQAVSAIQGKARYFRRRKSGKVKDPFHPNRTATRIFLRVNRVDMCTAVANELSMPMVANAPGKQGRPASPKVPADNIRTIAPNTDELFQPIPSRHPFRARLHGSIMTARAVGVR